MIFFAHGLYLDEFLWFAIPVGLSLWVLRWAERRARARAEAEAAETQEDSAD
ncbi:MAG: hypothetical protein WD990_04515 [Acidimicrobiia bacterium]